MDNKKTIVIFSCFYEPYMSGAELAVKEIVERLSDRYYFIILAARISRKNKRRETRDGYEIRRLGPGTKFDKYFYPLWAPWIARTLNPKIVHAVMESYAGIALWLYRVFGGWGKTVLTLQSGDLDMAEKQLRINKFIWKKIHTSPNKVVAISSALAARAKNLGAKNVSVIPNGVDFNEINKVPAAETIPRRIISVARLSAEKGLDYLISAFRDVKGEFPEAQLVLVGEGAERERLEKMAALTGFPAAISFSGRLPHDKALLEIKKSEIFVLASLGEGMGIVLAEAEALGVAAIATSVGGIPDVIEDGVSGLLIPPKDPAAIAAAILKIFRNSELRKQLTGNALQSVKKFDWSVIAGEYDKLYQSL
jgi:glycosyltransferase involved in cell wall biosynthesis